MRFYLIALIILAVVPLLIISGALLVRQSDIQRQAFERSLRQTSLALSVAVDRQLNTYLVMLQTLAEADELRGGEIDAFHALSARVAERHGAVFVSLFDRAGKQIFNTLRPAGVPLPTPFKDPRVAQSAAERPPVGDASSLKLVLQTGQPYVSDIFHGLVAGRLIFTVNIPVSRDGQVVYVLNAAFAPEVMTRLLKENVQFSGVPAVIFDRRGFIVGRWKDAEEYAGRRSIAHKERLEDRTDPVVVGVTMPDGVEMLFSHARSRATGWGVNVGLERAEVEGAIHATWALGGALEIGGLVLGLLLALWLASRLRQSIASLAECANRGEPPKVRGLRTREIALLEQALNDAAVVREAEARERESRITAQAREAQAEEANRVKDHFIAVLSHELRNPLAPIRSGVTLLRALSKGNHDSQMDEIVNMLDRQSLQLTRLVNDLLDISRISSGKIVLQRDRIDLRDVALHAIEAAGSGLEARGHRLIRALPGEPVAIIGDFARLSQVVSNLLDNATKYTPDCGEIKLTISTEAGNATLSVQDTGRGIAAALLPHVFSGFILVHHRSTPDDGGLGLGLSLSKSLVQLHGGTLEAFSEGTNKGSCFTVRIPLLVSAEATADEERAEGPARSVGTAHVPRRVLVVDDNVDAAHMLDMVLKSLGHETAVTHDGISALNMAPEFRPDVVLLDIGMPGLDGYEVARRLRGMGINASLRIIALTGWGQKGDRIKSQEAGFDLHLVKPVEPDALARAVQETSILSFHIIAGYQGSR